MTPRVIQVTACLLLLLCLCACVGESPNAGSPTTLTEHDEPALGVALTSEDQAKLGVEVATIESAAFQPSIAGPAYVVDAQSVVGTMAELRKAEADSRNSTVALQRARDLFNSDAAVSAETLEAAERQAATDEAQLRVARARATLSFGAAAPWLDAARRESLLVALSGGAMLLVSASFPSGLAGAQPAALALRRLGLADTASWCATEVWAGPADPRVPGPTVLALLAAPPELSPGERLTASVATGSPLSGLVVPLSAVVLAGGESWCYVTAAGADFVRRRVDLSRPLGAGYFQADGFAAGERIVVAGAGLLLAREFGGGAEAE